MAWAMALRISSVRTDLALGVERHVVDGHAVFGEQVVACVDDLVHGRGVNARHDVALVVEQRRDAGVAFGDDAEDEVLRLGGVGRVPVLVVGHQGNRSALRPVDELVGARAGGLVDGLPAGAAAAAVEDTMGEASAMARFFRNGPDAVRRVIFTVVGSTASTDSTPVPSSSEPNTKDAYGMSELRLGASWRSMDAFTASALKSVPSWNLTPSRSLMVYVRPSSEISGRSAARQGDDLGVRLAVLVQAFVDVAGHHGRFAVVEVRRVERARVGREAVRDGVGHSAARRVAAALALGRLLAATAAAACHVDEAEAGGRNAEQLDEPASAERRACLLPFVVLLPSNPAFPGPSSERLLALAHRRPVRSTLCMPVYFSTTERPPCPFLRDCGVFVPLRVVNGSETSSDPASPTKGPHFPFRAKGK